MPDNLTEYARIGYHGNECPHLWSSPAWYAHQLGSYLHATGRPIPTDVRMGRGQSIRARDLRFTFTHGEGGRVSFERIE